MTDDDRSDSLMSPIRPEELDPGAVIAQSLDNQWVPAQLTREMIERGESLDQVDHRRVREVRAEYFRSLINASQVVINRAYFYNNDAISRDLVEEGEARAAQKGEAIHRAVTVTPAEAEEMVADGRITDGFTVAALYRARLAGVLGTPAPDDGT
ncbi:hypothetical protein [Streptomyces flaveolus]|uniref:hypothetical protein n=1 Tax=Streptomyces flaveolus TaxID=67297 RepID=UPI0033D59250